MTDEELDKRRVGCLLVVIVGLIAIAFFVLVLVDTASARDLGQWTNQDPAIHEWYEHLMQPDNPAVSCCGEADAYWADDFHVRNGKTVATVTDDRDDVPLRRPHIDVGTQIEVPDNKLKYDQGNPTHHGVIFMSKSGWVYCYVLPGGV